MSVRGLVLSTTNSTLRHVTRHGIGATQSAKALIGGMADKRLESQPIFATALDKKTVHVLDEIFRSFFATCPCCSPHETDLLKRDQEAIPMLFISGCLGKFAAAQRFEPNIRPNLMSSWIASCNRLQQSSLQATKQK
jgi:hypothetical protein